MTRQRKQVDPKLPHIEGQGPGSLDGVGMNENATLMCGGGDLPDRLDGPHFVVGIHHGYQAGLRTDCLNHICNMHDPVGVAGNDSQVELLLGECFGGVQCGVMLDCGRDDMRSWARLTCLKTSSPGHAFQGEVVALRGTAGEDHFRAAAAKHSSNLLASAIETGPGVLPNLVDAGWVAECPGEIREKEIDHAWIDRSRRGVVEIDRGLSVGHG